jgi:hypothetical protein
MTTEELKKDYEPNWDPERKPCEVCEGTLEPLVPVSGFCGPCHWGTARVLGGDWWDEKNQCLNDEAIDG